MNMRVTFWNVSDKGGGPPGNSADEGPGPTSQTLIRQPEEVRHTIPDAPHKAGRTTQNLQRSHHPTWDSEMIPVISL